MKTRRVCWRCFSDEDLQKYIKRNASSVGCDFCAHENRKIRSCELEVVADFIIESLSCDFEAPEEHTSRIDGEWAVEPTDGSDLFFWELGLEVSTEGLRRELSYTLSDTYWVPKDIYGSEEDDLQESWEAFTNTVKHSSRYMFLQAEETKIARHTLETLAKHVKRFGLVRKYPVGTRFFRARCCEIGSQFSSLEELGPAPLAATVSSRMSPMGVSVFYGALDRETTLFEVADGIKKQATVVEFQSLVEFRLLDLSRIPEYPSLFDERNRKKRPSIAFLQSFLVDFKKRILRDDREHLEYVPTQIVAEYFRYLYRDRGERIDGILFPSSKVNGIVCGLFIDQDGCFENGAKKRAFNHSFKLEFMSKTIQTCSLDFPIE